jgi:hypothetical protein
VDIFLQVFHALIEKIVVMSYGRLLKMWIFSVRMFLILHVLK